MNRSVYFLRSRSKASLLLLESRAICTHSESLVYTMERNLRCFIPSRLRLEDLEFCFFGLLNRIFDLNTSSCGPMQKQLVCLKIYRKHNRILCLFKLSSLFLPSTVLFSIFLLYQSIELIY